MKVALSSAYFFASAATFLGFSLSPFLSSCLSRPIGVNCERIKKWQVAQSRWVEERRAKVFLCVSVAASLAVQHNNAQVANANWFPRMWHEWAWHGDSMCLERISSCSCNKKTATSAADCIKSANSCLDWRAWQICKRQLEAERKRE